MSTKELQEALDPENEFLEGQWWLKELDAMVENGTNDQKRAVYGVVRKMIRGNAAMRAALAEQAKAEPVENVTDELLKRLAFLRIITDPEKLKQIAGVLQGVLAAYQPAQQPAAELAMTDQQAALLNQAHDILLEHADEQRKRGNDSAANSAECSASVVLEMAAAWSAAQREPLTDAQLIRAGNNAPEPVISGISRAAFNRVFRFAEAVHGIGGQQ